MLEQFARDNIERVRVVGVGAQDDLAYAERFVSGTGVTFTMLWSASSASWNHFNIRSNSSVLLTDGGGNVIDGGPSHFDRRWIEEQLAGLA